MNCQRAGMRWRNNGRWSSGDLNSQSEQRDFAHELVRAVGVLSYAPGADHRRLRPPGGRGRTRVFAYAPERVHGIGESAVRKPEFAAQPDAVR